MLVNSITVVEHMLKFIEMISSLKMTLKFQSSIGPGLSKKVENRGVFFLLEFSNFLENDTGRGSCPSSSPSGNQV